jgi:hypothetical protein
MGLPGLTGDDTAFLGPAAAFELPPRLQRSLFKREKTSFTVIFGSFLRG